MIFREVQRRKVVPIVLDLRSLGEVEADALKDLNDALACSCKRVNRSQWGIGGRQGQVNIGRLLFLICCSNLLNQGLKFFFCKLLYSIDQLAVGAFFLIWNAAHGSHQFTDHTFLGNKLHSVGLQLVWGACICCCDSRFDCFDFLLIHDVPVNPLAKLPISKFFRVIAQEFPLAITPNCAYQVLPPGGLPIIQGSWGCAAGCLKLPRM